MSKPELNPTRKDVLVELTIAAPADVVWQSLRDPSEIRHWFGWDAPTLHDEIQFIFVDHAISDESSMTIAWAGRGESIEVEPQGSHCIVRLVRAGAVGAERDWDGIYEDETEGWLAFLTQLQFALERHRGEDRRTIYLAGAPAAGAAVACPREQLGIDSFMTRATGDRYEARLAAGEIVAGEVWATSRRQLALTVDAWGDGLLLVTDRSISGRTPDGGGSATLTTYGLSPTQYDELAKRWAAWWERHFPQRYEPPAGGEEHAVQ